MILNSKKVEFMKNIYILLYKYKKQLRTNQIKHFNRSNKLVTTFMI